jgi:uncharacterized protein YjaG (DUF416 family)
VTTFDPELLGKDLSALSKERRVAFCAACCQRMLPNYQKFSKIEGWGRPEVLTTALAEVWRFLDGTLFAKDRVDDLANGCQEAAPDTEEFTSLYTSSALDAASALVETLRCCDDGDPRHGVIVGTAARDSVDMYVQMRDQLDPSSPALEATILQDPLMQREIEKQRSDVVSLKTAPTLSHEVLLRLRESSSYDILS